MDDLVHQLYEGVSYGVVEYDIERRKMMSISLTKLHLKTKVIKFTNFFVYNYDINILRENIKQTNLSLSNKWKVYNTMPLIHIIILSASAPLCKMEYKKVENL